MTPPVDARFTPMDVHQACVSAKNSYGLSSDADVLTAIDALKAERDRLQRQLEFIATYDPRNGDVRQAFYSLRWYARECLYGPTSPGVWRKKRNDDAVARRDTSGSLIARSAASTDVKGSPR